MQPFNQHCDATARHRPARVLLYSALLLLLPLFFVGGPDWASGPLYRSSWNLGHILFFALLTIALKPWRRLAGWPLWPVATLVVLALGVVIEVLQSGLGRSVDWHDVLRNLIGTWLALAWAPASGTQSGPKWHLWPARLAASSLLALELTAVGLIAHQQLQMHRQLPQLYDFSLPDPAPYWSGDLQRSREYAHGAGHSLAIHLHNRQKYSGASLNNLPADWRGYRWLVLVLHNPASTGRTLTLRVNDTQHDRGANAYSDRFNTRLDLVPGSNSLRIPLDRVRQAPQGRPMDMASIRRLVLFSTREQTPGQVFLLDLRLEP